MRHYWVAVIVILSIVSVSGLCVKAPVVTSAPSPVSTFETATPQTSPATQVFKIPIVDAHSQITPENLDNIIQLMDQVGVT
jgi:hypothetical protein